MNEGVSPFNKLYCPRGILKPRYLYLRKPLTKRKPSRDTRETHTDLTPDDIHACLVCLTSDPCVHPSAIVSNGMTAGEFCLRVIRQYWHDRIPKPKPVCAQNST
jgi:hypothetical protein